MVSWKSGMMFFCKGTAKPDHPEKMGEIADWGQKRRTIWYWMLKLVKCAEQKRSSKIKRTGKRKGQLMKRTRLMKVKRTGKRKGQRMKRTGKKRLMKTKRTGKTNKIPAKEKV